MQAKRSLNLLYSGVGLRTCFALTIVGISTFGQHDILLAIIQDIASMSDSRPWILCGGGLSAMVTIAVRMQQKARSLPIGP
jgi:hypothetical protein